MKSTLTLLLGLILALTFCACSSVFSTDYYESEPFMDESAQYQGDEPEIKNYAALRSAILEMVSRRDEQGSFRFGNYSGSLVDDLAAVCLEIKSEDPLGAYAVQDISYDTSRIVSYYTCQISIQYKRSLGQINSVESVSGLGEFGSFIHDFMAGHGEKTVVRVYSSVINEDYIEALIHEYYVEEPLLTLLEPGVVVRAYPETGAERIYEISLDYGAEPEQLSTMGEALSLRMEEIIQSVDETDPAAIFLRLVQAVSEQRMDTEDKPQFPRSIYGCLVEGSGDSMGMALAYQALCQSMGLKCMVVEGEYKAEGSVAHAWNIITLDGHYYHVDPARFHLSAPEAFLLSDEGMWGSYHWERDGIPACTGPLGPGDVFELPGEDVPEQVPDQESAPQADNEPENE